MQKKKDKNLMKTDVKPLKQGLLSRIFHLYYDGFRTMTLGKTLWAVILIKLAIIFLVLKLFFFPDFINTNAKNGDKAGFGGGRQRNRVRNDQLVESGIHDAFNGGAGAEPCWKRAY